MEIDIKAFESAISDVINHPSELLGVCLTSKEAQAVLSMLKEHEAVQPKNIPEELKQKMWNALYAEEDRFEKKYIGTDEHDAWFNIYRPWLQKGFNIAINAIADWEGR